MAVKWWFKVYRTKDGDFPFVDWFVRQPVQMRANFDITRQLLSVTETWTIKDGAKTLTKKHTGLTELLIDFDEWAPKASKGKKRRFRPIGLVLQEPRQFLLFIGCEEIGGQYDPPGAFEDAMKYWGELDRGLGELHDHDF